MAIDLKKIDEDLDKMEVEQNEERQDRYESRMKYLIDEGFTRSGDCMNKGDFGIWVQFVEWASDQEFNKRVYPHTMPSSLVDPNQKLITQIEAIFDTAKQKAINLIQSQLTNSIRK